MTTAATPITEFEAQLAAACAAGHDARSEGVHRKMGADRYEDCDLAQAWRVGWDQADRELRETS